MILQALHNYYQRLEDDPDADIAPFGFSRQNIAFCVTLNSDGSLHEIADVRTQEGKKLLPLSLIVLGNAKPSGSGINPCFLWDNPAYLLGYKADDPKPERTRESFEAFRQRHLDAASQIGDPEFSAVCTFLKQWNPEEAEQHEKLVDIGTGFGVFRIRATDHYVHEREAVQAWWQQQFEQEDDTSEAVTGQCLITGEQRPLARLHEPKIKGVWGGQSSGAAIVSFNLDAFESYGKSQSLNAPVGERMAFQYCTALNRLLADQHRRIQIGDATTVFWTDKPTEAENLLPWVFDPTRDAEDEVLTHHVHAVLSQIAQGKYPGEFGEPSTPFYVLGLSPNAARISVRFWRVSTLGNLVANLHQHFADLAIARFDSDPEFPAVWQLLRQTARESKDIPPQLSGVLTRSILTGTAYPDAFYSAVLRRIRADREVWYLRAAALKAVINRKIRQGGLPLSVITESVDERRTEPMYHIGRLFRQLENLQTAAFETLETTIRHRYLASAMQAPATVLPRLLSLYHHHVRKLPKADKQRSWKTRPTFEARINSIVNRISEFPLHAAPIDQGLFVIGYHHERTRYVKSTPSSEKE